MSIAEEILQTRPFSTPDQEVFVALLKTADTLYRTITRITEQEELSLEQYNVLHIVRGAGHEGLPTLDISRRMIHLDPGMTRLLGKLQVKKLVTRNRSDEDQRKVMCSITQTGTIRLNKVESLLEPVLKRAVRGFSQSQRGALLESLGRIRLNEV